MSAAPLPLHSVPELHDNLDRTIPFDSIVFRPTSVLFMLTVIVFRSAGGAANTQSADCGSALPSYKFRKIGYNKILIFR